MIITPEIEKLFDQWANEAAKSAKGVAVLPLKKKIMDYLNGCFPGDTSVEYNGKTYKIREYVKIITDYARLIELTESRKAQTRGTIEMCKKFDNDLVVVSSHDKKCEICAQYEGKVFSISGTHPTYPKFMNKPPFHMGCTHSINPTSDTAIRVRKEWEQEHGEKK